jgi:hypothetical protein
MKPMIYLLAGVLILTALMDVSLADWYDTSQRRDLWSH